MLVVLGQDMFNTITDTIETLKNHARNLWRLMQQLTPKLMVNGFLIVGASARNIVMTTNTKALFNRGVVQDGMITLPMFNGDNGSIRHVLNMAGISHQVQMTFSSEAISPSTFQSKSVMTCTRTRKYAEIITYLLMLSLTII